MKAVGLSGVWDHAREKEVEVKAVGLSGMWDHAREEEVEGGGLHPILQWSERG